VQSTVQVNLLWTLSQWAACWTGFRPAAGSAPLWRIRESPSKPTRQKAKVGLHNGIIAAHALCALPIAKLAIADAFLFLWLPLRSVDLVKPLMHAWGFSFSGSAFVWAKLNKSGEGWFMGNGYGTRHNAEICWLGRHGQPQRKSKAVRELIVAPRREHSRKPDEVYQRIEALCSGPYLELFARQRWPGWVCVGDEAKRFVP
jgi:N6-adenosine-specific RNA methylase IME4